ncbi:MAG: transposase [Polyangiaceae bacterium]|nr:transposase [Polyangiaceae bacterium]
MRAALAQKYRQHHPEETPLFALVKKHWPNFAANADTFYRGGLPVYVRDEFRAYERCGIHAYGFARARCQSCGHTMLVAFSCKKRGICPSCNARRMADTAARLVDRVLPEARLRQWVLSVPYELRMTLARHPEALSAVGRLFIEEIFRWQRALGTRLGLAAAHSADVHLKGGAICFPQRFGGSLNLNVHYHVIVPDTLFHRDTEGRLQFEVLRRPSRSELEDITYNVSVRAIRWLERKGFIQPEEPIEEPSLLQMCLQSSLGLGELATLSRKGEPTRIIHRENGSVSRKVRGGEFNIHVGEPASGKEEREQLIRYCARAPLSLERLSISEDDKVVYQLKHPIGGKTHRVMSPEQFLARLCALIPPPRHPLVRFHGVFAPASKWREEAVTFARTDEPAKSSNKFPHKECAPVVEKNVERPHLDWATLLKRVYNIDALRCECGGQIRFEELIDDSKRATAFLELFAIQSPREHSTSTHVILWTDAPNQTALSAKSFNFSGSPQPEPETVDDFNQGSAPTDDPEPAPPDDIWFQDDFPQD